MTMLVLAPETKKSLGCILVVDDDEGVRENLTELFAFAGYRVLTAEDAHAAMSILGNEDVDLLLTDFRMPGPTGSELIESARAENRDLKAILMTSFGDTFADLENVRRGATGYLNKPFEADEITNLVDKILSLSEA